VSGMRRFSGAGGRERTTPYLLLALLLALIGAVGLLWRPLAPPVGALDTDLADFRPEVLATVAAYRTPRYVIFAVATTLEVLVPLLVVLTRRGRRLVARVAGPATRAPLRAAGVAFVVAVLTSLATFPLAAWSRIVHDGRWGFRTQSAGSWLVDWLTVSLGTWLAVAALVLVLMWAMARWPRSWPYRLTLLGSVLAAAIVLIHPLVLQPILLPTSPMPPSETRDDLEAILEEQGAGDLELHVGDASLRTTRVNAMVVGIGPTERVVLYDTLLELPGEQIQSVLAHELAHREHRDLARGVLAVPTFLLPAMLLLGRVLNGSGVRRRTGARGPVDPRLAAAVLATAAVLELVGAPVANVASRRAEAAADHRALEVTEDPAAKIAASRAVVVRDLSPPRAPTWVRVLSATHPAVEDRIRAAVAHADPDQLPSREELEEAEADLAHEAVRERLE
jgi:STE24 endopeptidase